MTLFLLTIACTTADSPKDNSNKLDGPQDTGTVPDGDHGMGAPDENPCEEISTTIRPTPAQPDFPVLTS